jgi:hypothetical protein
MKQTTNPLSKLWKVAALFALVLLPALGQASATSPCPRGCGYTYDPVNNCCSPDPRFDCVDFCL